MREAGRVGSESDPVRGPAIIFPLLNDRGWFLATEIR